MPSRGWHASIPIATNPPRASLKRSSVAMDSLAPGANACGLSWSQMDNAMRRRFIGRMHK